MIRENGRGGLEPIRSRLLAELAWAASAATLAARVGMARQKVNYHLHALEAHGLVRLARKRKWGDLMEGLLEATNWPRPSRDWFRSTTMQPPPADARIAC